LFGYIYKYDSKYIRLFAWILHVNSSRVYQFGYLLIYNISKCISSFACLYHFIAFRVFAHKLHVNSTRLFVRNIEEVEQNSIEFEVDDILQELEVTSLVGAQEMVTHPIVFTKANAFFSEKFDLLSLKAMKSGGVEITTLKRFY
jgi:hypothetical protein